MSVHFSNNRIAKSFAKHWIFSFRLLYFSSLCSLTVFTSRPLFSPWLICFPNSCFVSSPYSLPFPLLSLLSAVEAFEEVSDSLCVPQYNADGEERVILFLKMVPGKPFSQELVAKIKGAIRKALSARHVPALLLETRDIPVREIWISIRYKETCQIILSQWLQL